MKDTTVCWIILGLFLGGIQGGHAALCGRLPINPDVMLCCNQMLFLKAGLQPACCGSLAFDGEDQMCCQGVVRRKVGMQPRCCGTRGMDVSEAICVGGQITRRSSLTSSCCYVNDQVQCCRASEHCCEIAGSIHGFRPVCCELAHSTLQAHCCSSTVSRTQLLPSCCTDPELRPICCMIQNTLTCCPPNGGRPECCRHVEQITYSTVSATTPAPTVQQSHSCCEIGQRPPYCDNSIGCSLPTDGSCCRLDAVSTYQRCCLVLGVSATCCQAMHETTTPATSPPPLTTASPTAAPTVYHPPCCEGAQRPPYCDNSVTCSLPTDGSCCRLSALNTYQRCCLIFGLTAPCCQPRPETTTPYRPTPTPTALSDAMWEEPMVDDPMQLSCCIAPNLAACCRAASGISHLTPHCCDADRKSK